jgi:hypothetical protein
MSLISLHIERPDLLWTQIQRRRETEKRRFKFGELCLIVPNAMQKNAQWAVSESVGLSAASIDCESTRHRKADCQLLLLLHPALSLSRVTAGHNYSAVILWTRTEILCMPFAIHWFLQRPALKNRDN